MITNINMQDQIHNRIEELMDEKSNINWDEIFQNAVTLSLTILFITFGLSWSI